MEATASTIIHTPSSSEEPARHRCRLLTALVACGFILIELLVSALYALSERLHGIVIVSCALLPLAVLAGVSLIGGQRVWAALLGLQKMAAFALSFLAAGIGSACLGAVFALNSQTDLKGSERSNRDEKVESAKIVLCIVMVDYMLFLVMYVPIFYLYSGTETTAGGSFSIGMRRSTEGL